MRGAWRNQHMRSPTSIIIEESPGCISFKFLGGLCFGGLAFCLLGFSGAVDRT